MKKIVVKSVKTDSLGCTIRTVTVIKSNGCKEEHITTYTERPIPLEVVRDRNW